MANTAKRLLFAFGMALLSMLMIAALAYLLHLWLIFSRGNFLLYMAPVVVIILVFTTYAFFLLSKEGNGDGPSD